MRIYLDVCCMNRPFDDQSQDRIKLESEAILTALARCQRGQWRLVGSGAIDYEISKIPDEDRRQKVLALAGLARLRVSLNDATVVQRGLVLQEAGFTALDAIHIMRGKSWCRRHAHLSALTLFDSIPLEISDPEISRPEPLACEPPRPWLSKGAGKGLVRQGIGCHGRPHTARASQGSGLLEKPPIASAFGFK